MQKNFLEYLINYCDDIDIADLLLGKKDNLSRIQDEINSFFGEYSINSRDIDVLKSLFDLYKQDLCQIQSEFMATFRISREYRSISVYIDNKTWADLLSYANTQCKSDYKYTFNTENRCYFNLLEIDKCFYKDPEFVELFLSTHMSIHGVIINGDIFCATFHDFAECLNAFKKLKGYITRSYISKDKVEKELKGELAKCLFEYEFGAKDVMEYSNAMFLEIIKNDKEKFEGLIRSLVNHSDRALQNQFYIELMPVFNKYKFNEKNGYAYASHNLLDGEVTKVGKTKNINVRENELLQAIYNKEKTFIQTQSVYNINTFDYFFKNFFNYLKIEGEFYKIPKSEVENIFKQVKKFDDYFHEQYYGTKRYKTKKLKIV